MSADTHDASQTDHGAEKEPNNSTAFYLWLIITVSAGIIMAQDSWIGLQQPRLGTIDATAAFTKVMVIHTIWLVVTIGFILFTWFKRPTSAWKLHLGIGALTVAWTIGVLTWAFSDVERLRVSTWLCETAPTSDVVTDTFLESCSRADMGGSVRLGGDIFLWSADDEHFWRWIVPGKDMTTLQTRWPSQVSAMYLAKTEVNATLHNGAENSVPGGQWSAGFDPNQTRDLNIFYIKSAPSIPIDFGTPDPDEQ